MRQGCLLSPLLFNLVIETLVVHVQASMAISGIRTSMREQKLMLYADDFIFASRFS